MLNAFENMNGIAQKQKNERKTRRSTNSEKHVETASGHHVVNMHFALK